MYEYKRAGTTHPAITTKYFVCFRETFTSLIFKTSLPSPDIQTGNQTFKFGGLMFVLAFQSDDLQFISRNGFREKLEIFSKRVQDLDKCLGMDDALFLKYLNEKKAKSSFIQGNIRLFFFLSIPIPGFIPSDRVANSDHRKRISKETYIFLGIRESWREEE